MRRDWVSVPLLVLFLVVFGFLAWLTQNPESEFLVQAQEWPVVGPLAKAFRDQYLPEPTPTRNGAELDLTYQIEGGPSEVRVVRPWVWVPADTPLYDEPTLDSEVIGTIPSITNPPQLDRRGDWFRVRYHDLTGWVFLEDYDSAPPILGSATDPVLPLPGRGPSPHWLAFGRGIMGEAARKANLGPYVLYTDSQDAELLDLCDRVAAQIDDTYRDRYGLELVGEPAEVIFIFDRLHDFTSLREQVDVAIHPWADGFAGRGLVALYIESLTAGTVCSSLAHELTHLLNRRGLGPALPPWLDEGLAADLAGSLIDAEGRLHPEALGGEVLLQEDRIMYTGARAAALTLLKALQEGEVMPLAELIRLDSDTFYSVEPLGVRYAQSAFWLRYLLSGYDPTLEEGFRDYLAAVARGEALTEQLLLTSLDRDWPTLDRGYRLWLRTQMLMPQQEVVVVN